MLEAVLAVVGLLAAAGAYWLKKSADTSGKNYSDLEHGLDVALKNNKALQVRITRLKLVNRKLRADLVKERRKNYENLSADSAAERLRSPDQGN